MSIWFIGIVLVTLAMSYKGFEEYAFFERFKFNIRELQKGDYVRLVSSGFLHADWGHFIFNMISLYFFHAIAMQFFGVPFFLILYFGSLVCGNLLSWYIYRDQPYYSAIGASGAVSGVIFAAIAIAPHLKINFIPGWLFGTLYFGYSVYSMFNPRQGDNLGHSAHLGGAIFGLLLAFLLFPQWVLLNKLYLGIMLLPLGYMAFRLLKK